MPYDLKKDASDQGNLYLNVAQVAERYGVSTDTIWRWKREGNLPKARKVGPNVTRWCLSDLLAFEAAFETSFATGLSEVVSMDLDQGVPAPKSRGASYDGG